MLLHMAAAFALPKGPGSALVFYLCVAPCLLAELAAWPAASWRKLLADRAAATALALVVFSGLTLLWGVPEKHRSWQFAADTVATLGFLLAMLAVWPDRTARDRVACVLVVAGTGNAVFSISRALILAPLDPRLHGWGLTSHPILGALVMQTAYLTALASGLSGPALLRRGGRWPNIAAAMVMAVFILMTESRGPILAGTVATLFLCAAGPWRWRAMGAMAVAAGVWYALPRAVQQHSVGVLEKRGTSHRLEIWEYAARLIGNRPMIGHGLAANMHIDVGTAKVPEDITFPHDLYLSLLFYSGAIGLLLFLAMVIILAWRLVRGRADAEAPWLAAMGIGTLLGGLTDLGQITKGPGTLWIILWVPAGLAMGWWLGRKKEAVLF
jgi:O-antigen ligase